jgi:hypothetical protein
MINKLARHLQDVERSLRDQSHHAKPAETGVPMSDNQSMNDK